MVTQPKLKGSQDARDMLCNYFSQLTAATSHWYLINNDNTSVVNNFDFSQLVGMTKKNGKHSDSRQVCTKGILTKSSK